MKTSLLTAAFLAAANGRVLTRDLTVQTINGWSSMGCYTDLPRNRTLAQLSGVGEDISDTQCQTKCQQLGYIYAGTELRGQCYCDNVINPIAQQTPLSDCNQTCTADATQPCGAADRINLFNAGPSQQYNVPGWHSYGCLTDDTSRRALTYRITADNMTPQLCASSCAAANYTLAGVEYGSECFCDNYIQNNQSLAAPSGCNMACAGDSTLACGGPGRINVLYADGTTPQAQPVSSHAVSLPSGWSSKGCYTDGVHTRALASYVTGPSTGMTVEYCVNACVGQGYSLAGLEYGDECYCGVQIDNGQGPASDGCNKPCSGDNGEICGGLDRLSLYGAASCSGQLVSSLAADPSGTPFCSSYISVPVQTSTSVVTASAVTVTSYSATNTITVPVTEYTTTTVTSTTCSPIAVQKRDAAVPSQYASYATPALSSACSCLSIPASTTTVTSTSTPTSTIATYSTTISSTTTVTRTSTSVVNSCPTPSSCNNAGLQFGLYRNNQGDDTDHPNYSAFNPTYLKSKSAGGQGADLLLYSSSTNSIGGINEQCTNVQSISVYNNPNKISCYYFTLNHRGYLYAPIAGTYRFTFSSVDDNVYLWTGANALSGWTRSNAAKIVGYGQGNGNRGPGYDTYSFTMTQGQYLPIRIVFAQAIGPATFQLSLADPNGNTILSSTSGSSPYVIQYSCDGVAAPAFPNAFGSET